jgi:riboflavin synthase
MFSGIIAAVGRVERLERAGPEARLTVALPARFGSVRKGESVAVSGVCLTALAAGRRFAADLSSETLSRSTLDELRRGDRVNLERAVRLSDRLSGHLVAGHVDGTSALRARRKVAASWIFRFELPAELSRYVVEKGSIAVDGISLTVAALPRGSFDVAIVPHTLAVTTFRNLAPGDRVNLEVDVIAKYVERLLGRA